MKKTAGLITIALVSLTTAACSFSFGSSDEVSASKLEEQVAAELEAQNPDAGVNVECEDGVEAEEGAQTTCSFSTEAGDEGEVLVTVDEVDGSTVSFSTELVE
jgi:hypothetical protein